MKFIWIEFLKFLKNNIFKMIIGTVVIAGLFVFSSYNSGSSDTENVAELQQEERFRPDAKPANFYFYATTEEGTSYTNNSIIERYLLRPDLLQEIGNRTDTNLAEIIVKSENNAVVDYKESGETKVLGIEKSDTTHLNEFYVNVGNEEDNLAIANEYYDFIIGDNVPFLGNDSVYPFEGPRVKEIEDLVVKDTVSQSTDGGSIIQDIIIGIIIGLVVMTGILLMLTFITKKLKYSFSYTLKENDYFLLVDKKLNNENDVQEVLTSPAQPVKVIIQENSNKLNIGNQMNNTESIKKYNSILDIENTDNIDQLIYILEEGTTTREWYNKQRNLENFLEIPSVVIQINKNMTSKVTN